MERPIGPRGVWLPWEVKPDNATDKHVTFNSSDTSVATVSTMGVVTLLKEGNTDISVITTDGKYTDVCKIKVTPPKVTPPAPAGAPPLRRRKRISRSMRKSSSRKSRKH